MGKRKPLKKCANGCDRPPDPPSLVICKECQDKITSNMKEILSDMRKVEMKGVQGE